MAPALVQAAALALRASTIICPASPQCPLNDGCLFSTNGVLLEVSCATDYYGGDLQLAPTSTLAGCMKACSSTNGCVAVSYPTPPTEQACPTTYTCPENDGCTFTGTDTRTFSLSCGVDFYGGDLSSLYAASLGSCTLACYEDARCVAASFVGGSGAGHCYLKTKNNGKTFNDNVDDVSSASIPVASSLAPESPSSISSVATTVSTQTRDDPTPTTVAETATSVMSTQTSPTPTVIFPIQVVRNPSFEFGDGSDPTDWTVERLYIIDAGASGRVQIEPRTGAYAIRGRGIPNGGFDVYLSQTVTVIPGASYNIESFCKADYQRFLFGTSYTSISTQVDIPVGDAIQQVLLVDGACSLPSGDPQMYDLFIDDVTMSVVV
ncbi:hypothetical protein C7974DRAFT_474292 [Boeremia exigua]|uniref:uncharacterized protein n=1 Tax=Boeremia exigua TaxID=749465 RepID=UPI001E8DEA8D|nr:uncharacterized protein C7974DRAFT_474292 [Boeremia exigua]KAH6618431.1 hypothetical protein C7974DRAFT_474292 [Boeremia exigua]